MFILLLFSRCRYVMFVLLLISIQNCGHEFLCIVGVVTVSQ